MKTPHFRMRVIDVLRLQPMTPEQVARCLSTTTNNARAALREICAAGIARKRPGERPDRPQQNIFELTIGAAQ